MRWAGCSACLPPLFLPWRLPWATCPLRYGTVGSPGVIALAVAVAPLALLRPRARPACSPPAGVEGAPRRRALTARSSSPACPPPALPRPPGHPSQTLHLGIALDARLFMAVFEGSTHYSLVGVSGSAAPPGWAGGCQPQRGAGWMAPPLAAPSCLLTETDGC